jgi:hypothetical protein
MKKLSSLLLLVFLFSGTAGADEAGVQALGQEIAQLKGLVQDLKIVVEQQARTIQLQGQKIGQLESSSSVAVSGPVQPAGSQASGIGDTIRTGRWNPDIGVVADMAGQFTNSKEDEEGEDRWSVRELEVVFGSNVDAYSRLDATVSFSDFEEASLEEAYLTRYELPLGTTGRVGRFLPKIGKAISVHRDSLETVDEPLVIQRWFGHHGYSKTGADLTKVLDLPFASSHEITGGILEGGSGEEGTLFGDRRRPTFYSHLKNYWELGDASGLEWGVSHLIGSKDSRSSNSVTVIGTDLTYTHRFNDTVGLKLQGEAYNQNRRDTQYEVTDDTTGDVFFEDMDGNLWGGYGLADLRFHPQWSVGFRGDYVETVDNDLANPNKAETAWSPYLTFHQSEFARWRVQFTSFEPTDNEESDWQLMLQGTFAIGEHKHKIV